MNKLLLSQSHTPTYLETDYIKSAFEKMRARMLLLLAGSAAAVHHAARVLDGAVCVLDSNQGVEPQTETVWRQGDKYKVPRIVFCNKMDKVGADFYQCLEDIKVRLGARPVPIQLPIGSESIFKGIVDLVRMKAVVWEEEQLGAKFADIEIPEDLVE